MPTLFDVAVGDFREVTQADVDNFMKLSTAYGIMLHYQRAVQQAMLEIGQGKREAGTVRLFIDGKEV